MEPWNHFEQVSLSGSPSLSRTLGLTLLRKSGCAIWTWFIPQKLILWASKLSWLAERNFIGKSTLLAAFQLLEVRKSAKWCKDVRFCGLRTFANVLMSARHTLEGLWCSLFAKISVWGEKSSSSADHICTSSLDRLREGAYSQMLWNILIVCLWRQTMSRIRVEMDGMLAIGTKIETERKQHVLSMFSGILAREWKGIVCMCCDWKPVIHTT